MGTSRSGAGRATTSSAETRKGREGLAEMRGVTGADAEEPGGRRRAHPPWGAWSGEETIGSWPTLAHLMSACSKEYPVAYFS